ncbi:MAG: radical SAM protein [Candidatus Saganbacteria bacterium]|nr:radical SAM protein [Candidatus Saganbacteria bacterium]
MMKIAGLYRASRVLAKQPANVVLDRIGFRRGSIPLVVPPAFSQTVLDTSKADSILFSFRGQSAKSIRTAFGRFLSGSLSLASSFKNINVNVSSDFLSVLLVTPFSGDKIGGVDRIQPYKGIERIAYYLLRNHLNLDVMVHNPDLLYSDRIFSRDEMQTFDIIGFGSLDPVFSETAEVILSFEKHYPKSLKVIGGIAASHMSAKSLFASLPLDIVVKGFGENPMLAIVRRLGRSGDLLSRFGDIPGLVLNVDKNPVITSPPGHLSYDQFRTVVMGDFEDVPLGTDDRLHQRSYWKKTVEHRGSVRRFSNEIGYYPIRLGTSDYCRRTCVFCSAAPVHKVPRGALLRIELEPEDIIMTMKRAIKNNPQADSFHFDDDDFITSRKRIIKLCKLIVKAGLAHYPKLCKSRIDEVDEEILLALKKAGFVFISYGIESFSDRVLKKMAKGITFQQIQLVLDKTLEAGLMTGINLMLFNPFTTVAEVDFDVRQAVHYFKKGAFVFVNSRMEAYHGAPIMKRNSWIQFKQVFHPGMDAPMDLPTYVTIQDDAAAGLFEKAQAEQNGFLNKLSLLGLKQFPFLVKGLALFYGIYSVLGKPAEQLDEIQNLIIDYLGANLKVR